MPKFLTMGFCRIIKNMLRNTVIIIVPLYVLINALQVEGKVVTTMSLENIPSVPGPEYFDRG